MATPGIDSWRGSARPTAALGDRLPDREMPRTHNDPGVTGAVVAEDRNESGGPTRPVDQASGVAAGA